MKYHALTAWEKVERGNSVVCAHVETARPLNPENQHYLVLEVLTEGEGGGIRNEGFQPGIPVIKGEKYIFSCFYRLRKGNGVPVEIRLENEDGTICCGKETFMPTAAEWQKYECTISAEITNTTAGLTVLSVSPVTIELDMISLFPVNTFKHRRNGLRADIAEMLASMKPRFMRFPGGCLTHIGSLDMDDRCAMYRWKKTLGLMQV